MVHGDVAGEFARLAVELHEAPCVADTAERALSFAVSAVGCDYAGLALTERGGLMEVGASTDPVIDRLRRWEIEVGGGPLLDSVAHGSAVLVQDVCAEGGASDWSPHAAEAGVGSEMHVPMTSHEQVVGVLSLYSAKPHAFSMDDEAIAQVLAQHVSVAVATARRDETMAQAIDSRKLVGQAMGILMERFDLDSDQAFAVLRRYSQDTNTKLREVAQQLIDTRELPR
jgi:GAF domain-containing protein